MEEIINLHDVVKVVRCKHCKYWVEKGYDPIFEVKFGRCKCEHWYDSDFDFETDETDYCSWGQI